MENNMKLVDRSGGDDDEEEEEMKIEKFYSLLRSFRDARDRRRRELIDKNESNKKRMKTTTTSNPKIEACFQWQDFTTEIHFRKPPLIFPDPTPNDTIKDNNSKGEKRKEQLKENALDLKLAL